MILAEDVERLAVVNINTNGEIAVITDDSVTTASGEIVVRIRFKQSGQRLESQRDSKSACRPTADGKIKDFDAAPQSGT